MKPAPGSPEDQAAQLRALADRCAAGKVQQVIAVTVEADNTFRIVDCGTASFAESIGALRVAEDKLFKRPNLKVL